MAVWFTSDTHFGDPRVLSLDRRPWPDLRSHDDALADAWRAVVAPGDTLWHLGDFARPRPAGRVEDLLASLPGEKHLVIGNNDGPETTGAEGWASVAHYREIEVDGRRLVLCHYPFRTWNNMGKGWIDLHGHSHGKLKPVSRQVDVGVDAWGFRPVSLAMMVEARRSGRSRRARGEA